VFSYLVYFVRVIRRVVVGSVTTTKIIGGSGIGIIQFAKLLEDMAGRMVFAGKTVGKCDNRSPVCRPCGIFRVVSAVKAFSVWIPVRSKSLRRCPSRRQDD
jgi:hypothetical protein